MVKNIDNVNPWDVRYQYRGGSRIFLKEGVSTINLPFKANFSEKGLMDESAYPRNPPLDPPLQY